MQQRTVICHAVVKIMEGKERPVWLRMALSAMQVIEARTCKLCLLLLSQKEGKRN